MKKILQFLLPPEQTIGIVLYFSFLCLILGVFSFAANYAMIYRHTAMAVSYFSFGGLIYWFFRYQKYGKSSTWLWLIIVSVFTLHKWWITSVILLEIIQNRFNSGKNPTSEQEQQRGLWQLLMIPPIYLTMDVAREYSVWQRFTLNYFPVAGIIFVILMSIYLFRRYR